MEAWRRKFMKFGWFVLGNGPLGNVTLIIGVTGQIGGGLNAGAIGTNVGTLTTST